MRKIRFGIIGTGNVAHVHAKAIMEMDSAELVACCNVNPSGARDFARKYGIRGFSSLSGFLSDESIDVVTIATPSGAHLEPALDAIGYGKNVIVEKPLEVTTERIDKMIEKAREKGVILSGIFQSRFYDASLLVKDALEKGRFGRVTLLDAQIKWYRDQKYYDSGAWRGTWKLDGGGALMNQGIHAVDLLLWLGGPVSNVSGRIGTLGHDNIEVEDTASAVLEFKSGALGTIEATTCCYPGFFKRIEICGTEGSAVIEEENLRTWSFMNETDQDELIRKKYMNCTSSGGGASDAKATGWLGHRKAFENVVNALLYGSEIAVPGEEARRSVELIEAVYKSARENSTVVLS